MKDSRWKEARDAGVRLSRAAAEARRAEGNDEAASWLTRLADNLVASETEEEYQMTLRLPRFGSAN